MYCFKLDREAKRHVEYLIKNKKTNWTYWDVTDRHSKTFRGNNIKIKAEAEPIISDPFPKIVLQDPKGPLTGGGPGVWRPPYIPERGEFDFSGYFWDPRMQ